MLKTKVDESVLAHSFADSAYHCEHHNFDLNSVGKFALSTLPREHGFKVVLTGEGADEHFAGYPFFPSDFLREPDLSMPESTLAKDKSLGAALWQNTQASLETAQRKNMGAENVINRASTCAAGDDEAGSGPTDGSVNMSKMPSFVQAWQSSLPLFTSWVRQHWADFDCRTSAINALSDEARAKLLHKWHPLHASEYVWCKSLLPNNLLSCLGDRTEMAHSIEARPPFLDHVLSEYVNGLPPSLKSAYTPERASTQKTGENPWYEGLDMIRDNFTEKWILREAGKPYITEELYKRKKHPYTAPTRWPVGGPLHTTMVQLCTRERVERLGFVDWDVVAYALATAFGDEANAMSFRTLLFIGAWVTLGERFGVKTADAAAWVPAEAPPVKVTVAGGDDVAEKGTAVLQVSECEVPRRSKIVVR